MKLTDKGISALKAKTDRYEIWEPNRTGLGVRVSATGRKSWVYMYRFGGRPRRMTLGTYPALGLAAARVMHAKAKEQAARGIDPGAVNVQARKAERTAETVQELAEQYLEEWAWPRKRSAGEDERILRRDVLPKLGGRKAKDITRRDIKALLKIIVGRGSPIMANRTLAVVRKMFKFGVQEDIIENSPAIYIEAPGREHERERVLDESEIKAFWLGLEGEATREEMRLALRLILVTAQRPGEVIGAALSEIDLDEGFWTIPGSRAKNGNTHRVPLSPLAMGIVRRAMDIGQSRTKDRADLGRYPLDPPAPVWLFPSRYGLQRSMTPNGLNRALTKALPSMGIIEHVTPHDLRRTAGTMLGALGINGFVQDRVLNHTRKGVGRIYDRYSYDNEKRHALEAWATHLEGVVSDKAKGGNVVQLNASA